MTLEPEFQNRVVKNWYFQLNMTLGYYKSLNEDQCVKSYVCCKTSENSKVFRNLQSQMVRITVRSFGEIQLTMFDKYRAEK